MTKPLALTDRQMRLVRNAAQSLPVQRRDEFLQRLAAQLTSQPVRRGGAGGGDSAPTTTENPDEETLSPP